MKDQQYQRDSKGNVMKWADGTPIKLDEWDQDLDSAENRPTPEQLIKDIRAAGGTPSPDLIARTFLAG